jgi:type VI secretion system protein VasD
MKTIQTGLVLLTLLLSACSSTPETPEPQPKKPEPLPTIIYTKISVSADVNPDIDNRPSPIVVRVYELKSLGKYTESDFYNLFENHESALGADLLGTEKFHLKPGEIHTLKHKASPGTQYIAVAAAYRDLNRAVWRDSIVLPEGKTTQLFVIVDKLSISVFRK